MTEQLSTRQAEAKVFRIEGDLVETTTMPGRHTWVIGYAWVTARVDTDGTDYTWRVNDGRKYAIGDTITVTVPA